MYKQLAQSHRHTSQGDRGAAARLGQNHIIFRAKAKFFGQKPAAKNEKNCSY